MSSTLEERLVVHRSLLPSSFTAAVNGTSVQVGTKNLVIISNGVIGGTNPSFTFRVQESDDDETFQDVSDSSLTNPQPTPFTISDGFYKSVYLGVEQFLRIAITQVTGTLTPSLISESIILNEKRDRP